MHCFKLIKSTNFRPGKWITSCLTKPFNTDYRHLKKEDLPSRPEQYQLLLWRGVSPPPQECPGYDTKQSNHEVPVMLKLLRMQSTPSLPSLPGQLWPGVVVPDRVLSMDLIELKFVLKLNWIALNRTVLTFKLYTYAELNYLKWNCFCVLNWIVWNRTVLTFNCL